MTMFISRMINDPTRNGVLRKNLLGRSVGLVVHTPKFWDCRTYDFFTSQFDAYRLEGSAAGTLPENELEDRYQQAVAHRSCRWPYRHMSAVGYAYWHGPKRRFTFEYMTSVGGQRFKVHTHDRYTRWFAPVQTWVPRRKPQPTPETLAAHRKISDSPRMREIRAGMVEGRRQAAEYARRRDVERLRGDA